MKIILTPYRLFITEDHKAIPYSVEWFFNKLSKELDDKSIKSLSFYFVSSIEKHSFIRSFIASLTEFKFIYQILTEDQLLSECFEEDNSNSLKNEKYLILYHKEEFSISEEVILKLRLKTDILCINITDLGYEIQDDFLEEVEEVKDNSKNKNIPKLCDTINHSKSYHYQINDIIFETLPQAYYLCKFIIESEASEVSLVKLKADFFSNAVSVLYLLENKRIKKNYRKREITLSSSKCLYIPLNSIILQSSSVNKESFLSEIKRLNITSCFLQRSPEFYFSNKGKAKELSLLLTQCAVKTIDEFSLLEIFYNRPNQVRFLNSLLCKYNKDTLSKSRKILLPKSFTINEILRDNQNHSNNSIAQLAFPLIIKPSYSGNHNMIIAKNQTELDLIIGSKDLSPDFIIQELITHGETLAKLYFLNNKTKLALRNSLKIEKDTVDCKIFETECLYKSKEIKYLDTNETHKHIMESLEDMVSLAKYINKEAGISLFNIDFIINKDTAQLYILEVNYFPSYSEFYETLKEEFDQHIINIVKDSCNT